MADPGEHHAYSLREAGRRLRLGLGRWPEPRPDQVTEDEAVGCVAQASKRSHGEYQRLSEEEPAGDEGRDAGGDQDDREDHGRDRRAEARATRVDEPSSL